MGELVKVLIKCTEAPRTELTAQFNPKELQVDKTVGWTNAQGASTENPPQEFKDPQSSSLSVTLYFDTYESKKDVHKTFVAKLEHMVTIEPSLGRPPLVIFQWNKFSFKGVVESLTQKYTMFLSDGTRCRCEVGFKMKSASEARSATRAHGNQGAGGSGGGAGDSSDGG